MRIAVVGGLAAGPAAAAEAKRQAPDAEVVMFEEGRHVSIGTCEIPYYIAGHLGGADALVVNTAEKLERSRGFEVRLRERVTALDARAGRLVVDALDYGAQREERFDRVILATGARARRLGVPGEDAAGVFVIRDLEDAQAVRLWLETESVRHVVVAGGGYIGVEMAEAVRDRGLQATILDPSGRVLNNTVACEASDLMDRAVAAAGVAVRAEKPTEILADRAGRVRAVRTDAGELVGCQMVVVSIGVEPRTELAVAAGARVGEMGGLAVDDRMKTSLANVWACGDVAEVPRAPDGRRVLWPLAPTGRRSARVAARNAASRGGRADTFRPIAGGVAVKAFGIEVGSVGLSLAQAADAGLDAVAADVRHWTRTAAFPGSCPIDVRLVVERGAGRLLGGQIVSAEGAALRADVLVPLVQAGATARELAEDLDLVYNPPVAPAVDPLKVAASVAVRRAGR
ncbi:FAD-dependent oxidoreductase [Rubrivirga sp. S365]|uniref:FAD-dependent oxidoreductase n=1 Tax=Rubrivirga litoralis TaxID=3075598 RepID=A0ABU3BTF7_9BACT|nr:MULTISPECIES: FAD-dependent oxidoreductase [unclassified Rubrivirga]MDT0632576.1 FAD-dependent oxidoreductase [Rubrivirga sp. F394]MDT7856734.1 FAD-dependent oxidoreductase [Rubrivirga sp. S365]